MRRWLAGILGLAVGASAYGQSAVQAGPAYTPGGAPGSIPLSSLATQPPGTIVCNSSATVTQAPFTCTLGTNLSFTGTVLNATGGGGAFSAITGGTNTTAAMIVGTGASLGVTGSGTIAASSVPLAGVTGLGTGIATFLATPTSANFAAAVTGATGTGAVVFATSPLLTTPALAGSSTGATTFASANASATNYTLTFPAVTDTVLTNTGLASPPSIGGTTPAAGAFTTLSASSTVSGAGFSSYLASPPAIGGTAAAAGTFTTVTPTTYVHGATVLCQSNVAATTAGTVSEYNLASCAVPANAMGTNGVLEVIVAWSLGNNANTKMGTLRYSTTSCTPGATCSSGTSLASTGFTASTVAAQTTIKIRETNAASAQITVGAQQTPYSAGIVGASVVSSTITTTATSYVNIDCASATTATDCGIYGYQVILWTP